MNCGAVDLTDIGILPVGTDSRILTASKCESDSCEWCGVVCRPSGDCFDELSSTNATTAGGVMDPIVKASALDVGHAKQDSSSASKCESDSCEWCGVVCRPSGDCFDELSSTNATTAGGVMDPIVKASALDVGHAKQDSSSASKCESDSCEWCGVVCRPSGDCFDELSSTNATTAGGVMDPIVKASALDVGHAKQDSSSASKCESDSCEWCGVVCRPSGDCFDELSSTNATTAGGVMDPIVKASALDVGHAKQDSSSASKCESESCEWCGVVCCPSGDCFDELSSTNATTAGGVVDSIVNASALDVGSGLTEEHHVVADAQYLVMEWTNAKVCELIELYRDRPVLWDCRLKEYKDRNKKQDALQEIADTFGVDKQVVEKKIKNVVCHFLREIKRERDPSKSDAGNSDVYKSKWFCFNNMLFLKDRNTPKETTDTITQDQVAGTSKDTSKRGNNENKRLPKKLPGGSPQKIQKTSATEEALSIMRGIQGRHTSGLDQFKTFRELVGLRIKDLPSSNA
ncbi:hypothetical protein FQA39_LY10961 [Lamprigera yunnana]|nr:hypothetical protein FQA39_LY10961 [Lamprigera yunnana]